MNTEHCVSALESIGATSTSTEKVPYQMPCNGWYHQQRIMQKSSNMQTTSKTVVRNPFTAICSTLKISAHPSVTCGDPFIRNGIELTYTNPGVKADGSVADSPPTWTWMISLVCGFRIVNHHVAGPIVIRHRHRSSRIAVIHQQQNPILNRGTPFHPI